MSPRTKQQFQLMREKGRQKILAAALKLFAEKGFYNTSMDDVVKRAKVSKGSAYHYFESKEALLTAVIVDGLTAFESLMAKVELEETPAKKLQALINVSFAMVQSGRQFWKLYFSLLTQMNLPRSVRKVLEPVLTDLFTYMKDILEKMGVKDAADESRILGAMLDGVFLHYMLIGEAYPLEGMRAKILRRYAQE